MYSLIPITSQPNNTFSCKVPVDNLNITLTFTVSFNEVAGYWSISVSDSNGRKYIHNLPLVPGQNILEQYEYMGIGSAYVVANEQTDEEWPNSTNLGSIWTLIWGGSNG